MECNKDEAIRAKDIAERKFTEKDFSGAKKFALKAQALFPGLDGISNMLTTIDVNISAENKVDGEMDLYGMLGVSPMADDDTVKKQYRRLLLLLHPDKNKSIGAENAFRLVSEAFNILSDKTKRSAYNTRRHIRMAQKVPSQSGVPGVFQNGPPARQPSTFRVVEQKVPAQGGSPAGPHVSNGNHKRRRASGPRGKYKKRGAHQVSQQAQACFKKDDTFWTVCTRCKMQYEYMRVYLNQMLKCPNCEIGFVAVEVPPPSNMAPLQSEARHHKVNDSYGGASGHWSTFSSTNAYNSDSKAVKESQNRRQWDSGFVIREEGSSKRMGEPGDNLARNHGSGVQNGFSGYNVRINVNKVLTSTELKHMVADKGLLELREQVRKAKLEKKAASKEKISVQEKEGQKSKLSKSVQQSTVAVSVGVVEQQAPEFIVPDPDFHVFDYERSERCFRENQVWAAYDNNDGMPRFYALIHEVVAVDPFKLKVSWLNSRNTTEFGSLDWVDRGFKKTCGDFWVGRYETTNLLNSFSHKVNYDKGPRGVIQIYPKKGEIWALYRHWSPNWDQLTPEEVVYAYDMVEVLEDYNMEEGVYVAEIIKVPRFHTVFREQPDPKVVRLIPKDEMFRFSHQVPHHTLTGYEKPNAPEGFLELDPAATPPELLQVISDTNEEQVTGFPASFETQSRKHQLW